MPDVEGKPSDFLVARQKTIPRAGVRRFPDKPMSDHGMHRCWYGCLERAGIVAEGTLSGERMHKAWRTAGQRVLHHTGNLKAVQKLLKRWPTFSGTKPIEKSKATADG